MTLKTPISCDLYDYIEIACMHRYDVTVWLRDGHMIAGQAADTAVGHDKLEYFVMVVDGKLKEIPMHRLHRMETNTPGASFKKVNFQPEATQ